MSKENMIVCVDDEPFILTSLKGQLKKDFNEYVLEFAESGEEAIELIDELMAEGIVTVLVISDWLMPMMKGDELLINLHQKYPNMVKIILTGMAEPEKLEGAFKNANLYQCLTKPWEYDELKAVIEEALQ